MIARGAGLPGPRSGEDLARRCDLPDPPGRAHLLGAGGAGMRGLAVLLAEAGWSVSGCDTSEEAAAPEIERAGGRLLTGHDPAHVEGVGLVGSITFALFGFFAALFSLTTVALGVGWLLGHSFWGFLAVSVALLLVIAVLRVTKPELMPPSNLFQALREERSRAYEDRDQSPRPASAAVGDASADRETEADSQP